VPPQPLQQSFPSSLVGIGWIGVGLGHRYSGIDAFGSPFFDQRFSDPLGTWSVFVDSASSPPCYISESSPSPLSFHRFCRPLPSHVHF
jgi:hypothetical protein